jgi:restriction system protein
MTAALVLGAAVYLTAGLALPLLTGAPVPLLIGCNVAGATLGWAITLAWLSPRVEARIRRQLLEQTTNLRLVSAQEFEWLVGELLRREGWDVEETGRHGQADGNVDLRIRRGDRQLLVQCKRWDSRQLGVDEVRKLAGTLLREGLPGNSGVLVTSSTFTAAAIAEAAKVGIELVDNGALILRLEAVGGGELVQRASHTDAPYLCPICATPMVLDHSPHGWWVHCPRYRDGCQGKHDLDPDPRRALELLLASG